MEQLAASPTLRRKKTGKYMITAVAGAVVFVFFLMLWYYVPVLGSGEPSYCARCHAMLPEYLTWQASGHAQFQCKECHRLPGASGFFQYQGRLLTELVFYRAGNSPLKSPISDRVPDSACLQCHSDNRRYSPFSDTVIPHQKHRDKGVRCVDCHAGVAHGRIVERGITAAVPIDDWNSAMAQEQMDYRYTTPRMAVCLDCHGKRQVNQKCSACHSKQIVPASHKSPDFERQHGLMAQKDFKPCNLCHSYSLKKPVNLLTIKVTDYINNNTFCFNCHLQKPSTHQNPRFMEVHGELARTRGVTNCFGCHDINQSKPSQERGPVNKVYCNKCHWFSR